MRNMKLGTKMAMGFGALIVITVGLGIMAIWNMKAVEKEALVLDKGLIPEIRLAGEAERDYQHFNAPYAQLRVHRRENRVFADSRDEWSLCSIAPRGRSERAQGPMLHGGGSFSGWRGSHFTGIRDEPEFLTTKGTKSTK